MTVAGLAGAAAVIGALFVLPNWAEYRFYNWQMSVLRKPSYAVTDLMTRASWLPIVQDFFSRMWLVVLGAALSIGGIVARWRQAAPAERLLVLWVFVGLVELTVHDSGNPRRYVMFIPALVALAALVAAGGREFVPPGLASAGRWSRVAAVPLLLLLGYLAAGSLVRIAFLDEIRAGSFSSAVRASAALSVLLSIVLMARWRLAMSWLSRRTVVPVATAALLAVALSWNLAEFGWWAAGRTDLNYQASIDLGERLPPDTLVQGKLANGLALENRIRPLFIGNGFGNFADRLSRPDVRYILTYTEPSIGYESGQDGLLIRELLDLYPNRQVVATFRVEETPSSDLAVLYQKDAGRLSSAREKDARRLFVAATGERRARD